jgi:AraC-like DNA-binding protein
MRKAPFFSPQVFRARLFRRDLPGKTPGGLTVICGGCEHCTADYRIDRDDFPYWCLEFVVGGRGEVTVAGSRPRALEPGMIFLYGPGSAYRMRSDTDRPLVKYFVDFIGRRAASLLQETGFPAGATAHVFPLGAAAEAFDHLIDAGIDRAPRAARRTALLLEALLLGLADRRVPDGAAESRAFTTYRHCRGVIDALDPKGATIRSIAATASACHIDSAYLCRLFHRFARTSPSRYLMRRRMEAATARLSHPDCLVKEAAAEFGFADPYYFSRAFKRFHGIAPIAFVRRRREGYGDARP